MHQRWLAYLSIGILSGVILLLFALRLQPVWNPNAATATTDVPQVQEPSISFIDPTLGPATAKVTIVEYADFECGPCADAAAASETVQAAFPNDVRLVWKYLPNDSLHPNATADAIAAQCAERQGKFWPYADELFKRQGSLTPDQLPQIAQDLGLNTASFDACNTSQDTAAIITKDINESTGLKITATPTIFVNEDRYVGALSTDELTSYVNAILHP